MSSEARSNVLDLVIVVIAAFLFARLTTVYHETHFNLE